MNKIRNHPLSVRNKIVRRVSNHKRGKIFFPSNFIDFGSSYAIKQW